MTKLTADDGDSGDQFGYSLALEGDTAILGAWTDEDPNGDSAGSAYVFERTAGGWSQTAKLSADDGDSLDNFGSAVALDGSTALVGAETDEDPGGTGAGAAYVFTQSNGAWSQETKLIGSDTDSYDGFGMEATLDGDTALVAASDAGEAYIFERSNDAWSQTAKLAPTGDAEFADSVALEGDTAVLGAQLDETNNGDDTGSAYVFERSNDAWSQTAKLVASDGEDNDDFGISVALSGDTTVVGAPRDDNSNGDQAGSAYVFERANGSWSRTAKLLGDDGDDYDHFGSSVALTGTTALVGAQADEDPNGAYAGSVYVFERPNDSWDQTAKLVADDGSGNDYFGDAVALFDDTALVGAYQDAQGTGSAYVFDV